MQFTRVYAITLRHFYLLRGSFARVLPLFIWVALDMVLWGFISKYLSSFSAPGMQLVPQFLGAVLLWDFFTRVMQGVTTAFFEDVWSRNFLNLFASPLTIHEYIAGLVLSSCATSAVGLVVMLALAQGVFGLSFFSYGLVLVPFLLILFLFGIALGIWGSAVVLRFGPASEWFIWPVPAIIAPFAGVFYPVATLPGWMQAVSRCLPPSYIFEDIRRIVAGGAVDGSGLAISGMLVLGFLAVACVYFTRTTRYAMKTGLIARYSAESIG